MAKVSQTKKKTQTGGASAKSNGKAKAKAAKNVDLDNTDDEVEDSEEEPDTVPKNGNGNAETKSTLLSECQKLFNTTSLYEVLNLEKEKASQAESELVFFCLKCSLFLANVFIL